MKKNLKKPGRWKFRRVLVSGGAGFIGSHLCERLILEGSHVLCVDNFLTGSMENVTHLFGHPRFRFIKHDVTRDLFVPGSLDAVLHFASPASPIDYANLPIQTLKVGALGTHKMLGLAKAKKATFLLASTSEVYGDPQVHPQPESYWGHVNPVGPRGVYDEAKRFGEAMAMAYHKVHRIPVHIARLFNAYGPRMRVNDGRAIPTFITQALCSKPITVFGKGSQTRSFCYIDDLIEGLVRFLASSHNGPMNIGNPAEMSVKEMAVMICRLCRSKSRITFKELPEDDPKIRQPDISLAKKILGWRPRISSEEGIMRTIPWFQAHLRKRDGKLS